MSKPVGKTGVVRKNYDVRFEEANVGPGTFCHACGRSAIPHSSRACLSCRRKHGPFWVAPVATFSREVLGERTSEERAAAMRAAVLAATPAAKREPEEFTERESKPTLGARFQNTPSPKVAIPATFFADLDGDAVPLAGATKHFNTTPASSSAAKKPGKAGIVIRDLRWKKNLSRSELAVQVNVDVNLLAAIEKGEREPDVSFLEKIAVFFDCKENWVRFLT